MATLEPTNETPSNGVVANGPATAPGTPLAKDQVEYTRMLEKRLSELENRLLHLELQNKELVSKRVVNGDNVESEIDNTAKSPSDDDAGPEPAQLPIVREIRKLNWINFANRFPDQRDSALIELLMGPPSLEEEYKKDDVFCEKLRLVGAEEAQQLMQTTRERNVIRPGACIQSVRITSIPLSRELLEIFDADENTSSNPLVFSRPFVPLIHYFDEFKKKLIELKSEFGLTEEELEDESGMPPAGEEPLPITVMTFSEKTRADNICLLKDFRYLIQFLEQEILPLADMFDAPGRHKKVCFVDLWHLFRVGEYIYNTDATASFQTNPMSVVTADGDQKLWKLFWKRAFDDKFELKCYRIDHNGEAYVCIPTTFTIEYFKGEKDIADLAVYPLRFAEKKEELIRECQETGQKCKECLDGQFLLHTGWALTPDSQSSLQYIASDVIIDAGEAMKLHLNWKFNSRYPSTDTGDRGYADSSHVMFYWRIKDQKAVSSNTYNSYWIDDWVGRKEKIDYCEKDSFLSYGMKGKEKEYKLRDEDTVLLPRRLFAYVLQERRFVAVDIRNLSRVKKSAGGSFENLVIDPDHMSLLQSLVHSHFTRKKIQDSGFYSVNQDIVHNKGRGLVILLHGVPGVGKTSTAETIAHEWSKPLLPITYGDLGLSPANVEGKLKDVFRLAQLWGCILLLDEADVFLSERKPTDLERNALVSVFLRVLEYYTGILFLTTNRVGNIDEAFRSRIHISLHYPNLGKRETKRIWKLNLDRLKTIEDERATATNQAPLTIDVDGISKFAVQHYNESQQGKGRWNGRQIRNAFLIASALARYEKENPDSKSQPLINLSRYDICARHFKTVADAGSGFDKYLYETKRKTPGEVAFVQGYRNDSVNHKFSQMPNIHYPPAPGQMGGHPNNQGFFPSTPSPIPQGQGHYEGLQIHNAGARQSQTQFAQYGYSPDGSRGQPYQHGHDLNPVASPQMGMAPGGYGQGLSMGMGMGLNSGFNLQQPPVTPSKQPVQGSPGGLQHQDGYSGPTRPGDDDTDSD
ncbi:ATP-binding protein [Aspergillus mulundensis]|uniref:AAA+ ATPase domain-containing protein n=1 Tax=Aspergillus mulundensis TaxID=1810919 RepID=A0A3D8T4C9_9EURO|nr:Uncharacterized protein DSM5745_00712 [Aspergillus mulundensis]RDW93390.1 Uncharacterized protein DSM5745_00712 [Aspergillus mulundensis]